MPNSGQSDRNDGPSLHPRALVSSLLDLVFPPVCQVCDTRSQAALCSACQAKVRFLEPPWCSRCSLPFSELATGIGECADCRNHPPALDLARSVGHYEPPLDEAIRRLKFHKKTRVAETLGLLMANRATELLVEAAATAPDCLVPVPLYWLRSWRRGFNQSLLLAQVMSRKLGMPVEQSLVRVRRTPQQTGLRRRQRLENLRGAFAIRRGASVHGRHILLVDDIMTTGATLNECAKVLKRAKCETVIGITAGRQVRD